MRKLKSELTKPYRIELQVDNRPLVEGPRLNWTVMTADAKKSFTFSSGSEWQAMHIWRTQCGGAEILKMYSFMKLKE